MNALSERLRLLATLGVSTWRGDWAALRATIRSAREAGVSRDDVAEATLQGTLFFGFPRTVTAFETLASEWPTDAAPSAGHIEPERRAELGTALFDAIYAENATAVHDRLRSFHAEFHDFVIESAYGRILARPGLTARERELLAVAALAAMDQIPQLVAHARGARRFGASEAEIRDALVIAVGNSDDAAALLRRV